MQNDVEEQEMRVNGILSQPATRGLSLITNKVPDFSCLAVFSNTQLRFTCHSGLFVLLFF